jgi:uncharacterized membrane protein YhaH (DUF805 family)
MNILSLTGMVLAMVAGFLAGASKYMPAIICLLFAIFTVLVQIHIAIKRLTGAVLKHR